MSTLNLKKGDLLNLTKDYSTLKNINLGLGWDVATSGRSWDLDSIAILSNAQGKLIDTVYYARLNSHGVKLNGDNTTGEGEGDDEVISIRLNEINPDVTKIGLFVNIFSPCGRDFSGVKNAYIRIVNKDNNNEICKYKLNESGKGYNAFHFANLIKSNGEWQFVAVGQGCNGSVEGLKEYFYNTIKTPTPQAKTSTPQEETESKKGFLSKLFNR